MTIYSNSERSEQVLVTECFFNLIVPEGFSYLINENNYNSNWKKLLGFRIMEGKNKKNVPY